VEHHRLAERDCRACPAIQSGDLYRRCRGILPLAGFLRATLSQQGAYGYEYRGRRRCGGWALTALGPEADTASDSTFRSYGHSFLRRLWGRLPLAGAHVPLDRVLSKPRISSSAASWRCCRRSAHSGEQSTECPDRCCTANFINLIGSFNPEQDLIGQVSMGIPAPPTPTWHARIVTAQAH